MFRSIHAALLTAGILLGCSTTTERIQVDPDAVAREAELQRQAYVRQNHKDQLRVQNVAFPLLVNSADLCGDDIRPAVGFLPLNVNEYPKDYRSAAAQALGLGTELKVGHVIPGGPAEAADLAVGDVLLRVNDKPIPEGDKAGQRFLALAAEQLRPGAPATFEVRRGESIQRVVLTPVAACNYLVALVGSDEVNAFADGRNILITRGMVRFVGDDAELATVIGHELAHNAMGHIDKKTGNFLLGSIFDVVAAAYGINTQGLFGNMAANAFSQDFEAEADYVGLYVLQRGNFPIEGAPDFWRRMAMNSPGSIKTVYSGTHPGTAERYLALEKGIQEIRDKQQRGEALRPTLKSDRKGKKDTKEASN